MEALYEKEINENNALRQELQNKDDALDAAFKEKDVMIKEMGEKEALLKAQLDVYLKLDLTPFNRKHLKELKFEQPTTTFVVVGEKKYKFPKTKAHFEFLKSLSPSERSFKEIVFYSD